MSAFRPGKNDFPAPELIFPSDRWLQEQYTSALELLSQHLQRPTVTLWAREVEQAAALEAEAREVTRALLTAAPLVVPYLQDEGFRSWLAMGREVGERTPEAEAPYYLSTPAVLEHLSARALVPWTDLGLEFVRRDRSGGEWMAEFFRASGELAPMASYNELVRICSLLVPLAWRKALDPDITFMALRHGLSTLGARERRQSLTIAEQIAQLNPWLLGVHLLIGFARLSEHSTVEAERVLQDLVQLAHLPAEQPPTYWREVGINIATVPTAQLEPLLYWTIRVSGQSQTAGLELLRSCNTVARYLTPQTLAEWCQRGEELLRTNEAEGVSYFRLQSRLAQDGLYHLSTGVALREVREVLKLYSQALMGRGINILPVESARRGAHDWVANEQALALFSPSFFNEFASKQENFEALKVMVTHQAGHLAFGTYDFDFEGQGELFGALRQRVEPDGAKGEGDYRRFFDLFADRELAETAFTLGEDARIDTLLLGEYRGLRASLKRIQAASLQQRPSLMDLPIRELFLETLMHMSVAPDASYRVPREFAPSFQSGAGILRLLMEREVTPEDVVEAALRLYLIASQIPNVPARAIPEDAWEQLRLSECEYDPSEEDLDALAQEFDAVNGAASMALSNEGDASNDGVGEESFSAPPQMSYRWDPRTEVMQQLLHMMQDPEEEGAQELPPPSREAQQELLKELFAKEEDDADTMLEWEKEEPEQVGMRDMQQSSPLVGSVAENDVIVFHYDEWDYRIRSYRPNWCRVNERKLKESPAEFYQQTLDEYGLLVHTVRRQFEMLRPEGMSKVKRLLDGEEIDLDAAVEYMVDRRSGHSVMDKVYWRRRKTERSVAVALLLDMSLSTDEHIGQELPARPAVSMQPNASRSKRIIDLEKEGLVLLTEALERLGDQYGIYGFSSAGRGDVQFYVAKDLDEAASADTRARFGSIVPLQGTRMGAALRHTTTHLLRTQAKIKVLLMLSDGRPQDRDYGTVPWEMERPFVGRFRPADETLQNLRPSGSMVDEQTYAVHDTKEAINEARASGITPFLISIDKGGSDYLREMCGDIGYEVVSDIEALPRRLPSLYRRLTT